MKNRFQQKKNPIAGFLLLILMVIACSPEDGIQDTTLPETENFITNITTAPDLEFLFEGLIKDETGIKSIHIQYEEWFIGKVIELDEHPKEFSLNYKFIAPKDALPGSSHVIKIDITDLGDNVVTEEVIVTLDLDVMNPVLTFESPLTGVSYISGSLLPMKINVTDDFSVQSLQIVSSDLNIDETITIGNGETNYTYIKEHLIPNNLTGSVTIQAIAKDVQGNQSVSETTIIVGENITYTNLYLVGGSTWYGWDPTKATKMWQDPNDDQWFITEFYYKTNEDIKFIGQLDWTPYNWGLDPDDSSKIINAQNSEAIGFVDGDGYYRVRFSPYLFEYTYEKMTIDIAEEDDMYLMGKGFADYTLNWNPSDAIPMIKDSSNPYVFSIEVDFSDEVDLKFIGQNDGWGPYDAGFEIGGQVQIPVNYVKGAVGGGTADLKFAGQAGSYKITYDYFLLRTTIQPL